MFKESTEYNLERKNNERNFIRIDYENIFEHPDTNNTFSNTSKKEDTTKFDGNSKVKI